VERIAREVAYSTKTVQNILHPTVPRVKSPKKGSDTPASALAAAPPAEQAPAAARSQPEATTEAPPQPRPTPAPAAPEVLSAPAAPQPPAPPPGVQLHFDAEGLPILPLVSRTFEEVVGLMVQNALAKAGLLSGQPLSCPLLSDVVLGDVRRYQDKGLEVHAAVERARVARPGRGGSNRERDGAARGAAE
jgi:hypothetical protein